MKIPKRFGKYKITDELGAGSMGLVLKAEQDFINRKVAIKVLPKELEESQPQLVKRFRQEAIVAAKTIHPYLVPIFDVGYEAGFHYIVMEFVEGETLDIACKKNKWDVLQLMDVFIRVTKALIAIHSVEIVHRDMKAANIIYSNEGVVKILDFGIAKTVNDSDLTKVGAIMGSPDFMAPEQARAEEADQRADIFSFGVIMFLLLTGVNPFHRTKMDVKQIIRLRQRLISPPSMKEIDPKIPEPIDRIVTKCLAGNRDQRYQSSEELLVELERCKRNLMRKDGGAGAGGPQVFISGVQVAVGEEEQKVSWVKPIVVSVVLISLVLFSKLGMAYYKNMNRGTNLIAETQILSNEGNTQTAIVLIKNYLKEQKSSKKSPKQKIVIDDLKQQMEYFEEILFVESFCEYIQQLLKKGEKEKARKLHKVMLESFPDEISIKALNKHFDS